MLNSISVDQQLQSKKTYPYSTTYSTSVHKQARMGRISSKGVEWRGTELGDEITMATRTSAVWSTRGMWEGISC